MADPYECLRLENQFCFPLYVCAKEFVRRYRPYLDDLGLTYTQYLAMIVMWGRGRISVKDIGMLLHLDSGTLTPLLRKLEEKGYVSRSRDSFDERSVIVEITPEGEALKDRAKDIPSAAGSFVQISPEDAQALYGILTRLMMTFGPIS